MSAPTRFTGGITQAANFQPLGQVGVPDPFFYAYYEDDFLPYNVALYTVTAAGGTVAATAAYGSGGRILVTTGATAGNFGALQLPVASFAIISPKKLAFLCRIQVANVTTSQFSVGLSQTTATPFTVTDGIVITKAAGSLNLVVNMVTGSVVIGTTTITAPAGLANATDFDLGFLLDRSNNLFIYAGNNLEGAQRQDFANIGPQGSIRATSLTGALTAVLLNPTIAISNGTTAAAMTGVADFMYAAQER
jgi:hypothetical protein